MGEFIGTYQSHVQKGDVKGTGFSDSSAQFSAQTSPGKLLRHSRYARIIAPLCIALGQFSGPLVAETHAQKPSCTLTDGTGLNVGAHRKGQTCLEVVQLPNQHELSIIEQHGQRYSDNTILMLESNEVGQIYGRNYTQLQNPTYDLPLSLSYTTSQDIDVICNLGGQSDYTCAIEAPVAQTHTEAPAKIADRVTTQKQKNAEQSSDTCLNMWGARIAQGIEDNGYTCVWKATHFGVEYVNFSHDSHPTFVVFSPQTGSFFWDYGQVDQETFKVVLGPTPQNTDIRATSQPDTKVEHLSIIEKIKGLIAAILSSPELTVRKDEIEEVSATQSPEKCIQNPIQNMALTQKYGHTEFAKNNPDIYGPNAFHNGIDLNSYNGSQGQSVRHALCFGTVKRVQDSPNQCGSCSVRVETVVDGTPYTFLYFHLACPTAVSEGEDVNASTVLGTIWPDDNDSEMLNNTGPLEVPHDYCSDGPHLHLGLYTSDEAMLDPLSLLPFKPVEGSGTSYIK